IIPGRRLFQSGRWRNAEICRCRGVRCADMAGIPGGGMAAAVTEKDRAADVAYRRFPDLPAAWTGAAAGDILRRRYKMDGGVRDLPVPGVDYRYHTRQNVQDPPVYRMEQPLP